MMGIILMILPIIAYLFAGTVSGFVLILGTLFLLGVFNTIQQSSAAGLGGTFPFKYMAQYILGTGLAGVTISLLRTVILLSLGSDADTTEGRLIGILVYFGVAGAFLILCIHIHYKFVKTTFCRFYVWRQERQTMGPTEIAKAYPIESGAINNSDSIVSPDSVEPEANVSDTNPFVKPPISAESGIKRMYIVFKEIKWHVILMILIYVQTFTMFPGVMLLKTMTILDSTWETVLLIMAYNVFDSIGKTFTNNRSWYNINSIAVLVMGRFVFFAPFILMAVSDNIPVISEDWFAFVNVSLFAMANGFATSALFIMGPEGVTQNKKEVAGFVMMFSLQLGIVFGTFLALAFQNL